MDQISIKAYAKLNLSLNITGVRDDGYHFVDMVMQSIDIADHLEVRKRQDEEIVLHMTGERDIAQQDNLVYRAATMFCAASSALHKGYDITLNKCIPSQAGLGGGSSDAAATLIALNYLNDSHFTLRELEDIGIGLGADIPFCLHGGCMRVKGIGERLTPLPVTHMHFLVIKPAVGLSTAQMYQRYDRLTEKKRHSSAALQKKLLQGCTEECYGEMTNALYDASRSFLGELERLRLRLLSAGARHSMMSGSGSAMFGIFENEKKAREAAGLFQAEECSVYVCKSMANGSEILESREVNVKKL